MCLCECEREREIERERAGGERGGIMYSEKYPIKKILL